MQFLETTLRNWFCLKDKGYHFEGVSSLKWENFQTNIILTSQLKEVDKSVPNEYFSHHPSGLRIKAKKIWFKL